jgi:YidC/Oxa1 family membrane protein insertase
VYRNAMVGWVEPNGTARRSLEDSATVHTQAGGDAILKANNAIQYAAIGTQFFAAAIAVSDKQEKQNFLAYARATAEGPNDPNRPWLADMTVRAVTDPLELAAGDEATHDYLLYHGPVKVRLLHLLKDAAGNKAVSDELVNRYEETLNLRTLTDYQMPGAFGRFAHMIYWTDAVIFFTNLMHSVLGLFQKVFPGWLSIILLTVFVRLLLHLPSRKQTKMNMEMQAKMARLQPEMKKLQEKYGDDPQGLNMAKMKLMRDHGMNPLAPMGGCLLVFAQMPIFMGLYYALQESVFFRLERFLWMPNLAAPDMLVWWTERVPFLSSPDAQGGMLYLGPFLNVLPIISVTLMLLQQKYLMPPPTDEQQEMQQKMMKYMMVFMGIMFYKVPAGLCLYFIVSTAWGLIERKLIPKPKLKEETPADPFAKLAPGDKPANGKGGGIMARFREKLQERVEELQQQAEGKRQIRNADPNNRLDGGNGKKRKKRR